MKRTAAIMLAVIMLTGCSIRPKEMEKGLQLRTRLVTGNGCSFDGNITADYGDRLYTFCLRCSADEKGNVFFTVIEPETISGITGTMDADSGSLTFGETVLAFPLLADGQVTPVSAPWIFLKTLRGGYITSAGKDGEYIRLSIDDSYEEDALHLDLWLDGSNLPVRTEIRYRERRILSMDVTDFHLE